MPEQPLPERHGFFLLALFPFVGVVANVMAKAPSARLARSNDHVVAATRSSKSTSS